MTYVQNEVMMLLLAQDGNDVNISTLGTLTEIGVTGSIASIMVEGHTWEVNATSGSLYLLNIADIEYFPLLSGGSSQIGTTFYGNLCYPFEPGQTMKAVTELDPILISSTGRARSYKSPLGEMSFDHIFISERDEDNEMYVQRISTDDFVAEYYSPDSAESEIQYSTLMYDDCTAYVLEQVEGGTDVLLRRVVFDGGGGTATTVYTIAGTLSQAGTTFTIYDLYVFCRVRYDSTNAIVVVMNYVDDNYNEGDVFTCVIYHPNTGVTNEQQFDCGFDANTSFHYATAPSIYQNKVVFTANPTSWNDPPTPVPATCYIPTFIINVTTHDLTTVNDYLTDTENGEYVFAFGGTIIDQQTGIYYFCGDNQTDYQLFQVPLSSPSISVVPEGEGLNLHLFQGPVHGYGVNRTPAPGSCTVYSIPGMSALTSIDVYVEHNADFFEGACAIDYCHDLIWNIRENTIQGKAIDINATNRNITVNWVGGSVPFAYANNRELFIRPLAGRCLVLVYSTGTVGQYQSDWYLLRVCPT